MRCASHFYSYCLLFELIVKSLELKDEIGLIINVRLDVL